MKNAKRLLSLFLCAAAAASATACSTAGAAANSEAAASSGQDSAVRDEAYYETVTYDEPITISYCTIPVRDGVDYNNDDDYAKWWTEKFNIQWDIISVESTRLDEMVRVWINSGDMPDLLSLNYNHSDAMGYVDQGLIRRLPDDWKEKWPAMAEAYSGTQLGDKLEEIFGGTYVLPRPLFAENKPIEPDVCYHQVLALRSDWLTELGFEMKDSYKTSEIIEMARALKEKDPGNVGDSLIPIGGDPTQLCRMFVDSNSTHASENHTKRATYYKDESGQYVWGPANEETLTGLKLYNQAYREGLLYPEFFNYKGTEANDAFDKSGYVGMLFVDGMAKGFQPREQYFQEYLGLDSREAVHYAYVQGEDGYFHSPALVNMYLAQVMSPAMDDATFERLMDVMNYTCTPEGILHCRMGLEGVDWEYDENGEPVTLWTESAAISEVHKAQYPLYNALYINSDDFNMVDPNLRQEYKDLGKNFYVLKKENSTPETFPAVDWDVFLSDSVNLSKVSINYVTDYAEIAVKDGDVEENWKAWIEEQMPMVQPALDDLNNMAG
ncbi:MAG TPA: ABC transporter substrate-binding protein [Candidatus Caccousia avistercoris]|nr:ABC transporter substrate-binding protein [Candidatus Caccousia avistercoris]